MVFSLLFESFIYLSRKRIYRKGNRDKDYKIKHDKHGREYQNHNRLKGYPGVYNRAKKLGGIKCAEVEKSRFG